jgi:DNA repair ATPase RecN
MRFSGSNFQSWPEFDLEISGLTVVVGPSNKGKSALFRALKGALRNELSASYVRNGQKKPLELTLRLGDHTIIATRGRDSSSVYNIDGEPFSKLAEAIPDDIKKLGYNEIKVGDFHVDPIFATQSEPQFMLDKKAYGPSMLNAILGAFGGTEKLEAGKKEANLRITQKNSEAKTLSFEIAEAHQRRDKLETLAAQGNAIATEIHTLESLSRRLEARAVWMGVTHQQMQSVALMGEFLNLLQIPDTSEVERLTQKVASLRVAGAARAQVSVLADVETFLARTTAGWSKIVVLFKKAKALRETVPLVEEIEASTAEVDAKALNAVIGHLEDIYTEATRLQGSIKYIEQIAQLRTRVTGLQHERLHIEAEQDAATKLKCPQCGAEF